MYIALEGLDGAGKNHQAVLLTECLQRHGWDTLQVVEPDEEMPGGLELRRLLQSGQHRESYPGLFLANRMALMATKVIPALTAKRVVISVRSFLSTLVYQQQEIHPLEWLIDIHRVLPAKYDFMFILDVSPEEAAERMSGRTKTEYYERLDIQTRNRQRYRDLAHDPRLELFVKPGGVHLVPSNGIENVHDSLMFTLETQTGLFE